jgi:two-component sensor histidine kinase
MLFESKQTIIIILSILSYCLNFAVLLLLYKYYDIESAFVNHEQSDTMYLLNFSFTIFIIITLLLYYSYNNTKVNSLLSSTNEALIAQQTRLKKEIVIRKKTEEELVSLLSDKSMLLTEINHRVKNNLAVIAGLLELETLYTKEENTIRVITENKDRIKSIALLHEQLYQNKNTGMVDVKELASLLDHNLRLTYKKHLSESVLTWNVGELELTMDLALPITLIINELIIKSFKNKTVNSKGIHISIHKDHKKINLTFHAEFSFDSDFEAKFMASFAYNLIEALVAQVNGTSEYRIQNGLSFKMSF